MAPRFRRTLYIKDDDYRYSFLFGHYVTLTNLTEHDWWRIETMKLSPLYVSVHVTDLEQRRRYLRNESAEDIIAQLQRLIAHSIEVHTQLVIVPEVNDGRWLEESIADLAGLWPGVRSISIVPVGLTSHHKYGLRPHTREEAAAILDYIESLQPAFQERFGIRFVYATDEWYLVSGRTPPPLAAYDGQELHENGLGMVRNFLDSWQIEQDEIVQRMAQPQFQVHGQAWPYQEVTLVTATLFESTLLKVADEFAALTGSAIDVQAVVNKRLGETITVAGLLMGRDVLEHLQARGHGDLVILPRVMFDHPDVIALDDLSPQTLANRLGCTVALADTMGDVWDAITGVSRVIYHPLEEA
jgi:putative radical SAM enzyme (TIGR03279 family)